MERFLTVALLVFFACGTAGQHVVQSRGVDPDVDYESLKGFGPWDDCNYRLTKTDLELLAPNEHELTEPIPAFFRVQLRRDNPNLQRAGPAQYPRSALQTFLQMYGGYLVEGKVYPRVRMEGDRYVVIEEGGVDFAGAAPLDERCPDSSDRGAG